MIDYTNPLASVISDTLLPKISAISDELLSIEEYTMKSPRLDSLRRQLKYYRLLLGAYREIQYGKEEVSSEDMTNLMLLCGAAPIGMSTDSLVTSPLTDTTVFKTKTKSFEMYLDNASEPHSGSIPAGLHTFRFKYTGPGAFKVSAAIGDFLIAEPGSSVTFLNYSTGQGPTISFKLQAYSTDLDIMYTQTKQYTIT